MQKAYENPEFLASDEARDLRLLSEYLEPKTRLARHGVHRAIVFFGSARTRPLAGGSGADSPDYYRLAADLSQRLADWTLVAHPEGSRYHFCSGGGPGIMQAMAEGAARVDAGLNVGFNISLPHEQYVNPNITARLAFEFHYFFMRKFWFMNLAKAVVVFPGGFGTLDELFEVLTLVQTGKSPGMPMLLFGSEFWQKLVNFEELCRRGYIAEADLALFSFVDSVEEAFASLRDRLPP